MSFSYFVFPDVESIESFTFPHGLSHFFEQYGGYEEKSEVAQLSHMLSIDLSIFQQHNEMEAQDFIWHYISSLRAVIASLLEKINSSLGVFAKVRYGEELPGFFQEFMQLAKEKKTQESIDLISRMSGKTNAGFPADRGYLQGGQFLIDLNILDKSLEEMQIAGAKKIKLYYM